MLYQEDDISFERITPREFEELCFDIVLRMGYQSLIWRQGGADNGRDIEGKYVVNNQLVGPVEEKWFFECKHYTNGVPVEQVVTKVAWADAEKPNHLVIFVSSYLSNNARQWLEKIESDKHYMIHVIENKSIKTMVVNSFPELIDKYFVNRYEKLLLETSKNWIIHDLLPDVKLLELFVNKLDLERLTINEIAFLWCVGQYQLDSINEWCLEKDNEPLSLDYISYSLVRGHNCDDQAIKKLNQLNIIDCSYGYADWNCTFNKCLRAKLIYKDTPALYIFVRDSQGEGLEVLVFANSNLSTKIRYIRKNARGEMNKVMKLLFQKADSR